MSLSPPAECSRHGVHQPDFEQKKVADLVSNFFSAQNLVAEQVGVMEYGH